MKLWSNGLASDRGLPDGWHLAQLVYPHQLAYHPKELDVEQPLLVPDQETHLDKVRPSMNEINNANAKFALDNYQRPMAIEVAKLYKDVPGFSLDIMGNYGLPDELRTWGCRDGVSRPTHDVINGLVPEPKDQDDLFNAIENIAPLLKNISRVLLPSLYDPTPREKPAEGEPPQVVSDALWAKAKVQIARRIVKLNGGGTVVAVIWPRFRVTDGEYLMSIPELLSSQVLPALEGGADGLLYWSVDSQFVGAAEDGDEVNQAILVEDYYRKVPLVPVWEKDGDMLREALAAMHEERMKVISAVVGKALVPHPEGQA